MRGWWPVPAAALALLVWWAAAMHERQIGALTAENKMLVHANDSLQRAGRGLDTVYVRQTDTLRLVRRHTDSVMVTDTVIRTDSVRVLVEAERRACDAVLATCEQQKANLRSQLANIEAQLKVERKRRPSWLGTTLNRALWFGIGVGAGAVLNK